MERINASGAPMIAPERVVTFSDRVIVTPEGAGILGELAHGIGLGTGPREGDPWFWALVPFPIIK